MTPAPAQVPAIELVRVSKRYRTAAAVDDVTLTIQTGTVFGLIGPNGAGKSTTIRMLMGMLAPSAGQIRVLGVDVAADAAQIRRRVGYVPERHDIYPWMTVGEVIDFVRSFYKSWDDDFCAEMFDLFAIDRRKKVKQLSKGMLVKLSLLLAVSHRPELLILDEPTSGLDPIVHEDFLEAVLKAIASRPTTVLFSSHNLDDIRRLADRVGIMRLGKLVVHRGIDELLTSTKRVRAVLSDGRLPRWVPEGTIWQRVERREWLLTIGSFHPQLIERIRSENDVETVEVIDLGLGELFRDYILGEGANR
jgi:ABC-2 type transport system ATP-binding protein